MTVGLAWTQSKCMRTKDVLFVVVVNRKSGSSLLIAQYI